jgi:hypothetical protein
MPAVNVCDREARKTTYLAMIKNSVETKIFLNLYARKDGTIQDITERGNKSCAFFVSSILYLMDFISSAHATVDGTVQDMVKNKFTSSIPISKMKPGDVIVWNILGQNGTHKHIGFFIGNGNAISVYPIDELDTYPVPRVHSYAIGVAIQAIYVPPCFS